MAVSMGVLLLVAVFVGGYWASRHSGPRIPDYYPVFGPNPAQTKTVVNFWIRLPSNLSLGRKIELLAESLSRFEFCGLPVELVSLKGGTAVFNLLEHPGNIHIVHPPDLAGCAGATCPMPLRAGESRERPGGGDLRVARVPCCAQVPATVRACGCKLIRYGPAAFDPVLMWVAHNATG